MLNVLALLKVKKVYSNNQETPPHFSNTLGFMASILEKAVLDLGTSSLWGILYSLGIYSPYNWPYNSKKINYRYYR